MWHAKRRQTLYETIQDRRGVRHDNKTLDVCDIPREDRRCMRQYKTGEVTWQQDTDVCDIPREDRRGMRQYKTGEVLDMTTTGCMWHAKRRQTRYEIIQDRRGVRHDNKTVMYVTCQEKTDEVWDNTRQARC